MTILILGVLGVLAIVAASQVATRMRVAAPLLLVLLGILVSLLPFVPDIEIDPEWILAGVLPPLLYSAAVQLPTMEFRRDFRAISGLSVILVVISAVLIGLLAAWVIPGLGIPAGIALGAIVSPTDAVATGIVKRLGVSPRVVSLLEGESLLNDATALVVLRSAIVAISATVSFWGIVGDFAFAVAVAVAIGLVVGWLNLRLRAKVADPAVNTAISLTIPFLASVPAELLGASGLVAAVTAGIITGRGAARYLTPTHRLSDAQNWRLIELLLEGVIFLTMGLELSSVVNDVEEAHEGVWNAIWIAAVVLLATILIRGGFVAPLLAGLKRTAERSLARKQQLEKVEERIGQVSELAARGGPVAGIAPVARGNPKRPGRQRAMPDLERFRTRVRRFIADVDYMQAKPLGAKEGVIVVWAGMRGAVTLAAAQTLPADAPTRSLLVLIAFVVAAGSLLVQGGTLAFLVRKLGVGGGGVDLEERKLVSDELRLVVTQLLESRGIDLAAFRTDGSARQAGADEEAVAETTPDDQDSSEPMKRLQALRLEMIHAQRSHLLRLQKDGTYSSDTLRWALQTLDAEEIAIGIRAGDAD